MRCRKYRNELAVREELIPILKAQILQYTKHTLNLYNTTRLVAHPLLPLTCRKNLMHNHSFKYVQIYTRILDAIRSERAALRHEQGSALEDELQP